MATAHKISVDWFERFIQNKTKINWKYNKTLSRLSILMNKTLENCLENNFDVYFWTRAFILYIFIYENSPQSKLIYSNLCSINFCFKIYLQIHSTNSTNNTSKLNFINWQMGTKNKKVILICVCLFIFLN